MRRTTAAARERAERGSPQPEAKRGLSARGPGGVLSRGSYEAQRSHPDVRLRPPSSAAVLPMAKQQLPSGNNVLSACKKEDSSSSGCSVLTQEGVLKGDTVLEKPNTIVPSEPMLPSGGTILPKGGSNLPQK